MYCFCKPAILIVENKVGIWHGKYGRQMEASSSGLPSMTCFALAVTYMRVLLSENEIKYNKFNEFPVSTISCNHFHYSCALSKSPIESNVPPGRNASGFCGSEAVS